jgi:hypothetical protein
LGTRSDEYTAVGREEKRRREEIRVERRRAEERRVKRREVK